MATELCMYPGRATWYDRKKTEIEQHPQLTQRNKDFLFAWDAYVRTTGKATGKYTVAKRWCQMVPICVWLGKDLDTVVVSDVQRLLLHFDDQTWSDATRADYRRSLKQLYRWLEEEDTRMHSSDAIIREEARKLYRHVLKNVSSKPSKQKKVDPEEVLTEQDLKKLLTDGCKTVQERAIISALHETGARTSELFSVRIKHFKVLDRGLGRIYFPVSKTETRIVDLLDCVPYLTEHLKSHPWRDDGEQPLFYYVKSLRRRKTCYETFNHARVYHLVESIFKRAGLQKQGNPHWFRHSRASLDATSSMSPEVRCKRMGWVLGSNQIRTYSHLGEQQVKDAWLKERGITLPGTQRDETIACANCKQYIKTNYKVCPHCLRPTSQEVLQEEQEAIRGLTKERDELMELIPQYKDPELQREFIKTLKEITKITQDPAEFRRFQEFRFKDKREGV